jgi:DNA-directed RNA polymerase specialized sigma24 family protein
VYVYVEGLSHEEAAELLGVSRRTIGNLLDRFVEWAREQVPELIETNTRGSAPGEHPL